jgi:hypothetical protein
VGAAAGRARGAPRGPATPWVGLGHSSSGGGQSAHAWAVCAGDWDGGELQEGARLVLPWGWMPNGSGEAGGRGGVGGEGLAGVEGMRRLRLGMVRRQQHTTVRGIGGAGGRGRGRGGGRGSNGGASILELGIPSSSRHHVVRASSPPATASRRRLASPRVRNGLDGICHGPRADWVAWVTVAQATVAPRSSAP